MSLFVHKPAPETLNRLIAEHRKTSSLMRKG
jgi:hypothetical protein